MLSDVKPLGRDSPFVYHLFIYVAHLITTAMLIKVLYKTTE